MTEAFTLLAIGFVFGGIAAAIGLFVWAANSCAHNNVNEISGAWHCADCKKSWKAVA